MVLSIPAKIASMIAFHYRTRNLYRLSSTERIRSGRGGRPVSFNDFSSLEHFFYNKRDVIEEIHHRNIAEVWYTPLLLASEIWNLDQALLDAQHHLVKMKSIFLTYTHIDQDDIQSYLDDLQDDIYSWKQRKKREIAKRDNKFHEYQEQLQIDWENECWTNYTLQRNLLSPVNY